MPTGRTRYSIVATADAGGNTCLIQVYKEDCSTLVASGQLSVVLTYPTEANYRVKITPLGGWTGGCQVNWTSLNFEWRFWGHVYRTGTQSGLGGAVVSLWQGHRLKDTATIVAQQTTNADGAYELWLWNEPGVAVYVAVREQDPPGCVSTSPNEWEDYLTSVPYSGHQQDFYDTPPFELGLAPVNDTSCVDQRQDFVVAVTDSDSADRITAVELLFDTGVWMRDAVRVRYDHVTGLIYLRNDDNTAWLGGHAPETSHVVSNSSAQLHVSRCEVATGMFRRKLLLTIGLAFRSGFGGTYAQYVLAERDDGFYMGYDPFGHWTVDYCGSPTPTATPTPTVPRLLPGTHALRQGVNGYDGSQDVGISAWYPNDNFDGGNHDVMTVRAGDQFAGLIHFDLQMVPPDGIIQEATLKLYAARFQNPPPPPDRTLTVGAFPVMRDWRSGEATWMLAKVGQSWAEAGCNGVPQDRAGQAVDTVVMQEMATWYMFDLTDVAQTWVSQPSMNHGIVLKSVAGSGIGVELVTSEHGGMTLRPELQFKFAVPAAPTNTNTPRPTQTPTITASATWTRRPTSTLTPTSTRKPMNTMTPTRTLRPTRTPTLLRVYLPLVMK